MRPNLMMRNWGETQTTDKLPARDALSGDLINLQREARLTAAAKDSHRYNRGQRVIQYTVYRYMHIGVQIVAGKVNLRLAIISQYCMIQIQPDCRGK